jgi:hypothetical protein
MDKNEGNLSEMAHLLSLSAVAAGLLTFGFLYAYTIYHKPIDRTWLEVVIGVGVTITGAMIAQGVTYAHYSGSVPWWIVFYIPAAFALTGLPMIAFQESKFRTQKRKGEDLERKYNNDL